METKKEQIKALAASMLKDSYEAMLKNIDKALDSGAIDIENWSAEHAPMIVPKTIVSALLQRESFQYEGKGTAHEKKIKKDIKNIGYFL